MPCGRSFWLRLGDEIQRIRKEKEFTVVELAKKISISQAQLSYYENAQDCIPVVALYDIADVLGVKVRCFLEIGNKSKGVST